ncbi:leucine-rich repeat extensin-like protein 3 [Iris pallida]|uniref:Leucine-rich repeat extensin-like protein 3 n=1 Tax=Iris pallida TaxID=29817 RepID=A0AAX6I937_IRIPA|nr:leucine-rich repeat extensin-like protein 3 [Iris pallida]
MGVLVVRVSTCHGTQTRQGFGNNECVCVVGHRHRWVENEKCVVLDMRKVCKCNKILGTMNYDGHPGSDPRPTRLDTGIGWTKTQYR